MGDKQLKMSRTWFAVGARCGTEAATLGVAVVVPRETVLTEIMSAAVSEVLGEARYRATAIAVAEELAERSSVQEACSLVEAL